MPITFGGLFARLGDFATKIYKSLQTFGGGIADAIGLGRQAGLSPSLEAVTREWGAVKVSGESEKVIAGLRPWETVPHDLYQTQDIPWRRPFGYTVTIYGRDLATGRFSHNEYNITVSREMVIEEIGDEAMRLIGSQGMSPIIEIFDVKVTRAWIREGEEFR